MVLLEGLEPCYFLISLWGPALLGSDVAQTWPDTHTAIKDDTNADTSRFIKTEGG